MVWDTAFVLALVALLFFRTSDAACHGLLSEVEYSSLKDIYYSTNGAGWDWRPELDPTTKWKFPSELSAPCSLDWQGVKCEVDITGGLECVVSAIILELYNLTGTLPPSIGNLTSLQNLDLSYNNIGGTLPVTIASISSLIYLNISRNYLSGTISSDLSQLSGLLFLGLYANKLESSIPPELGYMTGLDKLYLYSNCLTGSIPTSVGSLYRTAGLLVDQNLLTGSLPTEMGLMSSLLRFAVAHNFVSGPIPTEIGNLYLLEELLLDANFFTSSIPSDLMSMINLQTAYLNINAFTGTIPSEIGRWTALEQFFMYENQFVGTIPSTVGLLTRLSGFTPSFNSLTGTIPTEMGNMVGLIDLCLNNNHLTGTIPTELKLLPYLQQLYLSYNSLTGSIPSEIGTLPGLQIALLELNLLTGSLPPQIQQLHDLIQLSVNSNFLTGSVSDSPINSTAFKSLTLAVNFLEGPLPAGLSTLPRTQSIVISENLMTGTIPVVWRELELLEMLNVSFNQLTGDLSGLFETEAYLPRLQYLDASKNAITGSLPLGLFNSSRHHLEALILYSNCFITVLPSDICALPSLSILVLDSLTSAPGCGVKVSHSFEWLVKALFLKNPLAGGIPACLWSMPSLTTLHLSGNGITGSLPELPTDTALNDVAMSNNEFIGSIPLSWQLLGKFSSLDLSCNRFDGTLSSSFALHNNGTLLSLSVNRLSGDLPVAFHQADNIDVLDGNLFQCDAASIPDSDPVAGQYVCGSDDLNYALLEWLVVVVLMAALGFALYWSFIKKLCQDFLSFPDHMQASLPVSVSGRHLTRFAAMIRRVCWGLCNASALILSVVGVTYILMKTFDQGHLSTHTHQYSWIFSAAYLHGGLPTALLMIFLVVLLLVVRRPLMRPSSTSPAASLSLSSNVSSDQLFPGLSPSPSTSFDHSKSSSLSFSSEVSQDLDSEDEGETQQTGVSICQRVLILAIIITHVVITVAVNVLYVYTIFTDLDATLLIMVQFLLGLFKIMWNSIIINGCTTRLPFLHSGYKLLLTSSLTIFTFLASPFLATFFSDDTCFRYLITPSPEVNASFIAKIFQCATRCESLQCITVCGLTDYAQVPVQTTAEPVWLYSYQCSSALLSNYAPVLLAAYLVSGVIMPIVYTLTLNSSQDWVYEYIPPALRAALEKRGETLLAADPSLKSKSMPLFNKVQVVSKLLMNVAILCTFGLAAPPVAVAVAVDSVAVVFMWQSLILKLVLNPSSNTDNNNISSSNNSGSALVALITKELDCQCRGATSGLHSCFLVILISTGIFWSMFVFDMLGDVYGPRAGSLAIIFPTVGLLVIHYSVRYFERSKLADRASTTFHRFRSFGINMKDVTFSSHALTPSEEHARSASTSSAIIEADSHIAQLNANF